MVTNMKIIAAKDARALVAEENDRRKQEIQKASDELLAPIFYVIKEAASNGKCYVEYTFSVTITTEQALGMQRTLTRLGYLFNWTSLNQIDISW
jgi:hypothetical protein